MCGRYSLTSNLDDLQARFDFEARDLVHRPRYNVAPTQTVLAVVNDGRNRAEFMRWGLIPFWAKDHKIGYRMINAVGETVATKSAFRAAFKKRRCLVLADGFYEWKKVAGGKVPMYITSRSMEPFAMAGLWENWRDPSGEMVHSCTIITTTPNSLIEPIHNRMPVILSRAAEATWLDLAVDDAGALAPLLVPYSADDMEAYAVSTLVNSPQNDVPECLQPAG
jgi:putative SOS response-associated peptidase YedK